MRKFLLVLIVVLCWPVLCQAGEDTATTSSTNALTLKYSNQPSWIFSITPDGQLEINGKSVEKMSDPEIKETVKKLFNWLVDQEKDRGLCGRQTDYLLGELEKCLKQKEEKK